MAGIIAPILMALQGFYPLVLAAFASIWAKVLAQGFMERLVAFLTFQGLHILAAKSTNKLDDQLLVDAAVAYYGKNPWLEDDRNVLALAAPMAKLAVPAPVAAPTSPVLGDAAAEATLVLPKADTGLPEAPSGSQEASELKELR